MVYRVENIVKDVRVALDENRISESLLKVEDFETLTLDEIIKSKIEESAQAIESVAPMALLDDTHNFADAIYWDEMESGWTFLPDDFMRLVSFRMSDWERTVHSAITPVDPLYDMQSSRYKGLRGTPQKPVCAIVMRPEGKVLEFYSCKSEDAYVAQATYIPYPEIDKDGGIDIPRRCYRAVVYSIAGAASAAIGAAEKATLLNETAKQMLTA